MEIAQIIDSALEEYYAELGLPVPNWKRKKNPDWWREGLQSAIWEHHTIADAVARKDIELARTLLRRHLENALI